MNKESSTSSARANFEDFWRLYPRKVGKLDAERTWKRVSKSSAPADILAGLGAQLERLHKTKSERGERFVPHPATWLNQGRWMDEVETTKSDSRKQTGLADYIVSRVQAYKRILEADPDKAERFFQQQPPTVKEAIERADAHHH